MGKHDQRIFTMMSTTSSRMAHDSKFYRKTIRTLTIICLAIFAIMSPSSSGHKRGGFIIPTAVLAFSPPVVPFTNYYQRTLGISTSFTSELGRKNNGEIISSSRRWSQRSDSNERTNSPPRRQNTNTQGRSPGRGRGRGGRGGRGRGQNNHRYQNNGRGRGGGGDSNLSQAKKINQELINSNSAQEILDIFISKGGAKGIAGDGVFNSVNYSTFLHRLARFATFVERSDGYQGSNKRNDGRNMQAQREEKRRSILLDPRFAILISSLSEALIQNKTNRQLTFNNRELANLGWAIAKLKVAPPMSALPINRISTNYDNGLEKNPDISYMSEEEMSNDISTTARKLRTQVLEVTKQRRMISDPKERASIQNLWIRTLSEISGKLLDLIASQVLEMLHDFNSQEIANLLYAFASAERADSEVFDKLVGQLVKSMERQQNDNSPTTSWKTDKRPKPQEFSNSVWAFASAGLRGHGQIKLVKYLADMLDKDSGDIVEQFKPQELSNTAWGIATLLSRRGSVSDEDDVPDEYIEEDDATVRTFRWVAKALQSRADDFKTQELSNSIWAFATVGFGASSLQNHPNNDHMLLGLDQTEEDRQLVSDTLNIVVKSALRRLHRFRPQELNNLAWGLCRLGHYENDYQELLQGIGQEILKRKHQFAPQDIGTTLWSFASMEYFDDQVYRAAAARLSLQHCRSFKPQELSNTVWALATAGALPKKPHVFDTTLVPSARKNARSEITSDSITECFAAATTELIRRPGAFKEQEIKDTLWSLSKAGVRHPIVFKKVAEHLVGSDEDAANGIRGRGLDNFSPQGLGNLAWSFAKQAQLGEAVSQNIVGSSGRLAVYETSCLDLGETLINRLFLRIAERGLAAEGLPKYKPQDLSNTCWAFATLGMLHRPFFAAVLLQIKQRLQGDSSEYSRFKAQEIANLVWSFATLNVEAEGMLEYFTPLILKMCSNAEGNINVQSIAKYFKRQETSNLAWSCAVLGQYPPQLMPLIYTSLFGSGDSNDAEYLKQIYGDDGLQRQAIMTLFYVQLATDMEAANLHLNLPPNFPLGWVEGEKSTTTIAPDNSETPSMLSLTTSRLQQDVSNALNRVDFQHIDEHVIRTDEVTSSQLSSEQFEFLSIDIANLDDLVGVEVDGPGHFINLLDTDDTQESKPSRSRKVAGNKLKMTGGRMGWQFSDSRRQVNGPTALKHRLLCHLGWQVVHVPYWEWRGLNGKKEDEETYCRELLEEITQ